MPTLEIENRVGEQVWEETETALTGAIREDEHDRAVAALKRQNRYHREETGYNPHDGEFLRRASSLLLQNQIRRAALASIHGEQPENAVWDIMGLVANTWEFMNASHEFGQVAERFHMGLRMKTELRLLAEDNRSGLEAERIFRELAGEPPEDPERVPFGILRTVWRIYHEAKSRFEDVLHQFHREDAYELERYMNLNLATVATAAYVTRIMNPEGLTPGSVECIPDDSP